MTSLFHGIRGTLILASCIFFIGCGNKTKNEYPKEVTDTFIQSCEQTSGGKNAFCVCILDKIQQKYTFEEFSVIEAKMRENRTPDEFIEFSGKARAECMK